MPDTITRRSFDYKSIDTDTAEFLQQQASQIKLLVKQTLESIIAVGQKLLEVKERLVHGQWMDWLDAEFGWTDRTALNYMRVATHFETETISDLDIAASALYLLTAPSTPQEARQEAISRAQAGEKITPASARELRDRYIQPQSQPVMQTREPLVVPSSQPIFQPQVLHPQLDSQQPSSQPPDQVPVAFESKPATSIPSRRKRVREERSLTVAPKRVQPGEWWKLGQDNYLYCGEPTSAEFQKLMPQEVALLLLSPPTRQKWPQSIPSNVISVVVDFTPYEEDQDLRLFREVVARHIQNKTDGGDVVVLAFLPDPAILSLVSQLDCLFFCADPDPKRCDSAITVWTTTGGTAERMKTRQTGKKRLSSPALTK